MRLLNLFLLAIPALAAPRPKGCSNGTPKTVVLVGARLVKTKQNINQYGEALNNLVVQADAWLTQGPWTVTSKNASVPNGTKHDYASQAPYWWPANWNNSASTAECPYVQRDGVRNPDVDKYTDRRNGASMMNSTYILSLAWWYTGKDEYRQHAGDILRTWFINEETKMTPNLQHAQIIPCQNDGRAIGIIDFSQQYTDVIDAVAILATKNDKAWSKQDDKAFRAWNAEYLKWLTDSDFGKEELAATNNHGTFAAMQIAAIAAYLEDYDLAACTLEDVEPRIDKYIAADGSQPLELKRTTSWHYTNFDLVAYTRMVAIGKLKDVDVDLWGYTGPDGQSIQGALKYIVPYASGQQKWPHKELDFKRYAAYDNVRFAADNGIQEAAAVVKDLETPPGGQLWDVRPATEQLDSILF